MQKRALETRERILKTAVKLFSKSGYHGSSVDLIAEKSGANKQRIYAYFGNKAALFESCLLRVFEEVNETEKALLRVGEKDIPAMTGIILRHYLEVHETHPEFRRLIAWANLESEPFYKCLKDIKERSLDHLGKLYIKGQSSGIFHEEVSFEVYIFTIIAVSFVYYSNSRTLSCSLDGPLFTAEGAGRLLAEFPLLAGQHSFT